MSLKPNTRKQRPLDFRTYDLEWIPGTYRLRLVGEHDGKRYQAWETISEFLNYVCVPKHNEMVWFAHAGGLADVQFILCYIAQHTPHWEVQACFSGSSAILVIVSDGIHRWLFADSYWLLRDKLSKIGESIGLQKGGVDYKCPGSCEHSPGKCIFHAPFAVLKDYNELDCEILWRAIRRLELELIELGGSLRFTIAGCAMHLFRSAFLTREIVTHESINETARIAYIASRVEVIQRQCEDYRRYDVNSSFPYSMTFDLPADLIGVDSSPRKVPPLSICDATVDVPRQDHVPPLAYRKQGRIFFPTGQWRSWFTSLDLQYLLECGGRIMGLHKSLKFEPFRDMSDYVAVLYERRRKETDPFRKLVYKYLLNSLYGKTAESTTKSRIVVNPESTKGLTMVQPGVFVVEETVQVPHAHVPIAAFVTARSRILLTKHLRAQSPGVAYCDTDSIDCAGETESTDALGGMKFEGHIKRGRYLAPKLYCLETDERTKVKAKGFRSLTEAEFDGLLEESSMPVDERKGVPIERMVRARELLKKGLTSPRDIQTYKRVILDMPKRPFDGNFTRPWTIKELEVRLK